MNKKYLSGVLFGALLAASRGYKNKLTEIKAPLQLLKNSWLR